MNKLIRLTIITKNGVNILLGKISYIATDHIYGTFKDKNHTYRGFITSINNIIELSILK